MSSSSPENVPLAVDLDGTLIRGDLFLQSLRSLLRVNPFYLFLLPLWLLAGKARLKQRVAERTEVDVSALEFRASVLEFVREEKARGRQTVIASGSDGKFVEAVSEHLACFDEVLASDGQYNCTGSRKARRLVERYGEDGFDYIGNSRVDLAVWSRASTVLVAAPSASLLRRLNKQFGDCRVFY